jgi:hypothetical protein
VNPRRKPLIAGNWKMHKTVAEAEAMRVRVMQLADSIGTQLKEQAAALAEMHERTKAFGHEVLEAHKRFINGGDHGKD